MRKYSNLVAKAMFIAFAMVAVAGIAGEDEILDGHKVGLAPFGCEVRVSGDVIYKRNGTLGSWSTQLHIAGTDSHLHVAGTKNPVERVRVRKHAGRTVVTMLFKNPPAVGGDGSVLFVGSVMDDGKKRYYAGEIYESSESHVRVCEHEAWFEPHTVLWEQKGYFMFKSPSY